MGVLPHTRDLAIYPVGARRAWLLLMATMASLICSFEGQTAPVLPLLLDEMDMSLTFWGIMSAATSIVGIISGALAGTWSDRVGRVKLLVPALFVTTAACFALALASNPTELFLLRMLQNFSEGFAIATTAPLIRDFSPRFGRAFGFGFWTWGPVGASFLGASLAATTLPLFDNAWQSQFVLQGVVCLVLTTLIACTIRDLSPELRAQIVADRGMAREATKAARSTRVEGRPRVRELLRYPHLWIHCIAITLWLVFYITITQYGQVVLTTEFGLTASQASGIMAAFWLLDLGTLLLVGWMSDRLQLRKPFSFGGTLTAVILVFYFASLIGQDVSQMHLMITGALIGTALAVAYAPWMANFSENAEDVEPRLQGTAWSMYRVSVGVGTLSLSLIIPAAVDSFGNWQQWLYIAGACQAMFLPLMFFFKGPWRRSEAMRETQRLRRRTVVTDDDALVTAEEG